MSSSSSSSPSSSSTSQSSEATDSNEWKLSDSSLLGWFNDDMFHPGNVLLFSSIPFCAGAYFGYKKPIEKMENLLNDEVASSSSTKTTTNNSKEMFGNAAERRALGLQVASRALRLATLGSVGTLGIIGAITFYTCGYRSMDEAIDRTTQWSSRWRQSFEDWLGMDDRESKTHPEVVATRHMTEDEELKYIYDKYIKEDEELDKEKINDEVK